MQLTLEVKDSKVPFLIELLKNFRFVKLTPPLPEDELDDLVCLAMYGQCRSRKPTARFRKRWLTLRKHASGPEKQNRPVKRVHAHHQQVGGKSLSALPGKMYHRLLAASSHWPMTRVRPVARNSKALKTCTASAKGITA